VKFRKCPKVPAATGHAPLIKWLGREEWRGSFQEVLDQHLGPACESAGIEFDEIAEILGDHEFMMLWACAFEDFLTRDCEPDGRNIVDDYLKRRGWKEPVANRRYMAALRASTMSLYEVSDIIAGQFLPSIRPPQALMSHTSGRITSRGEDQCAEPHAGAGTPEVRPHHVTSARAGLRASTPSIRATKSHHATILPFRICP
jgi:hypothetical protein